MPYSYDTLLVQTYLNRSKLIFLVMAIITVTLIVEVVVLLTSKSNRGISIWNFFSKKPLFSQRLSLRQQIVRDVIAMLILTVYLCCSAIPIYNDISQHQYITVEAEYSRTERDAQGNLFSNGHAYIEVGGDKIRLELPANWNEEVFPEGRFSCVAHYSKESKILLWIELDSK